MNILKIGDRYINFDQVTDVEFQGDKATIYFTSERDGGPHIVQFADTEATVLRQWLDKQAEDLSKPKLRGVDIGRLQGAARRKNQ